MIFLKISKNINSSQIFANSIEFGHLSEKNSFFYLNLWKILIQSNFRIISILVKFSQKFYFLKNIEKFQFSQISEKFRLMWKFRKIWIFPKISKNFGFIQIFEKKSILVKISKTILVKTSENNNFSEIYEKFRF